MHLCLRWIPGHIWVRLFINVTGRVEPGHCWMYAGILRRDAWRIGPIGFGILRLPKASQLPDQHEGSAP